MKNPPRIPTGSTMVDTAGRVWLPYDLARDPAWRGPLRPLHEYPPTWNAGVHDGSPNLSQASSLVVVNGMGVSLGDSVIGMNALYWLHRQHPDLQIELWRARHVPDFVEQIYGLVPWVHRVTCLPARKEMLRKDGRVVIDLGDIMFWPQFAAMPMVDFFYWAMGIDPKTVPDEHKRNRWLAALPGNWR